MFPIALLVIAFAAMTGCSVLQTRSIGSPFGRSIRAEQHIATFIVTQEPYIPSLHRNPGNDRFRIGLLLHPVDGGAPRRLIPIASQLRHSDFRNSARLLGSDGQSVWFIAQDIGAYDLDRNRLISLEHLRRANPQLDDLWQNARYSFGRRLQAVSHDYKREFEIDPHTLRAIPVSGTRRTSSLASIREALGGPHSQQYYKPAPVPDTGGLTASRSKPGLDSTIVLTRLDAAGKALWTADTGIADLDQILSDVQRSVFIGRKQRIPNKVQEPVLVIADQSTGRLVTHSLWQH